VLRMALEPGVMHLLDTVLLLQPLGQGWALAQCAASAGSGFPGPW
jgi:hypothetical protein